MLTFVDRLMACQGAGLYNHTAPPGPICESPPPAPFEGKITVSVREREVDRVTTCKVTIGFAQKMYRVLTWSELSKLSTKDAGPLVPSVSGPSMLNLKCPAFLKIFITDLQYGRKLGKWEQCHVKTEG